MEPTIDEILNSIGLTDRDYYYNKQNSNLRDIHPTELTVDKIHQLINLDVTFYKDDNYIVVGVTHGR